MSDIDWQPLPEGLWTPPAVYADVGNILVQVYIEDGVPTWEISRKIKTGRKAGECADVAKGTADSFEAAKAAALFEAGVTPKSP